MKIPSSRGTTSQPDVRIIFLVDNKLWIESTPINEAGSYGPFKIHEGDHQACWERLVASGVVPDIDYDEVPRARVSFNTRTEEFTLLADRCILQHPDLVENVKQMMHLPTEVVTGLDPHYRCPVCLRRRSGFDEEE